MIQNPVIPEMGSHWVDLLAPELDPASGKIFKHVYIIGSNKGEFTFWEPMVSWISCFPNLISLYPYDSLQNGRKMAGMPQDTGSRFLKSREIYCCTYGANLA